MAEKNEKIKEQQNAASGQVPSEALQEPQTLASETPNRDEWFAGMRSKYGEDKSDEELFALSKKGYDEEHEYAKQTREDVDEFAKVVQNNPTMLAFYQKVLELGEDDAEMALLELGDDLVSYLTGEIDSESYKERKKRKVDEEAENSRRAEEANSKRTVQRAALEAWAEKKGIDPDEFIEKVQTELLEPISAFSAEEALFNSLYNMIYHDEDVEAARVQERNAKIVEQRKKAAGASDGQMNRGSAAAPATPRTKGRGIFGIAEGDE